MDSTIMFDSKVIIGENPIFGAYDAPLRDFLLFGYLCVVRTLTYCNVGGLIGIQGLPDLIINSPTLALFVYTVSPHFMLSNGGRSGEVTLGGFCRPLQPSHMLCQRC